MRRLLIAGVVGLALLGAVVQLSCIASERTAADLPPIPPSLFTDALEPELPSASELDDGAGAAGPVLTY